MSNSQGICPKCSAPNEYSKTVCDMCGARLPWADAIKATASVQATPPVSVAPTAQNPFTKPMFGTKPTAQVVATPANRIVAWLIWLFIIFVALPTGCSLLARTGSSSISPLGVSLIAPKYSLSQYSQLQTGMSHAQATAVMGDAGEQMSRVQIANITDEMYSWNNGDGTSCNAQFQNDQLQAKGQFGLR